MESCDGASCPLNAYNAEMKAEYPPKELNKNSNRIEQGDFDAHWIIRMAGNTPGPLVCWCAEPRLRYVFQESLHKAWRKPPIRLKI
jgi:hypothetical protein